MGIAIARFGAEPLSVKCRICGRATPRGAKLCLQCVAAVKRARHETVITTQILPKAGPGSAYLPSRRARAPARTFLARSSWLPTKPGGWGLIAAFALFGAAIGATAYLAIQEIAEKPVAMGVPSLATDPPALHSNVELHSEPAVAESSVATVDSDEAPSVGAAPRVSEPVQRAPAPERRSPRKRANATHTAKRETRANAAPTPSLPAQQAAAENVIVESVQAGPPPTLASNAIAPVPPVRERWAGMNAALAACSQENFIAGVLCTERVRLEYCDGFWGQVPQCRAGTRPGSPL